MVELEITLHIWGQGHKGRHFQTRFTIPSKSQMMYELYCQRLRLSLNTISFSFLMTWRKKSIQLLIKPAKHSINQITFQSISFQGTSSWIWCISRAWTHLACERGWIGWVRSQCVPRLQHKPTSSVTIWNILLFSLFTHRFVKQTQFPTKKKRTSYLEVCFSPIVSGLEVLLQVWFERNSWQDYLYV